MGTEGGLNFGGIDVLTPGHDQVVSAVDYVEIAVRVEIACIAGVQPAIPDRLRGSIRPPPVAGRDICAPDDDLAIFIGAAYRAVFTLDANFDWQQRLPGRAGA